ncbi:acyl transferase/acyl hydrolase/lysophospholipase, partial [Dimargaris cristalligena]
LWAEVLRYWGHLFVSKLGRPSPKQVALHRLETATNYDEWYQHAAELDRLRGRDTWRRNPVSRRYDHRLIYARLEHLCEIDLTQDLSSMVFLLRSGLVRNLGGINEPQLFLPAYSGTKLLIEEYTYRIINILQFIRQTTVGPAVIPRHLQASFFYDTRQSYGRTVLILNGGSTFGLCHLGVAKALWESNLLPRIMYGTAVGALIGALLCCHDDTELPALFSTQTIDLSAFRRVERRGHVVRKLGRFLKFGYLMNVRVLEECIRDNIGDMTFEEAYLKTGRILNIMVSPHRRFESAQLLNYLAAPNVVIWSAACASTAKLGLFEQVNLRVKDPAGHITTWTPPMALLIPTGSLGDGASRDGFDPTVLSDFEQPYARLAELFNVNHSIISDASPQQHLPFVFSPHHREPGPSCFGKLVRLLTGEIRHRLTQLYQLRLLPVALEGFMTVKAPNTITLSPSFQLTDFYNMYAYPTPSSLPYWILKGEQAAWPDIRLIHNRCAIEFTLDKALDQL